jgi:hypothetical protein
LSPIKKVLVVLGVILVSTPVVAMCTIDAAIRNSGWGDYSANYWARNDSAVEVHLDGPGSPGWTNHFRLPPHSYGGMAAVRDSKRLGTMQVVDSDCHVLKEMELDDKHTTVHVAPDGAVTMVDRSAWGAWSGMDVVKPFEILPRLPPCPRYWLLNNSARTVTIDVGDYWQQGRARLTVPPLTYGSLYDSGPGRDAPQIIRIVDDQCRPLQQLPTDYEHNLVYVATDGTVTIDTGKAWLRGPGAKQITFARLPSCAKPVPTRRRPTSSASPRLPPLTRGP